MINPPIALYFMQGLNTTPLHGHAALFGVYGMLGIGLMLVCLRAMEPRAAWKEGWLRFAFWGMNAGLMIMCVGSLLPVGLAQTWASVEHGYWYARSTEFLGLPYMQTLRWMRVPGDTIFAIAALVLVAFVFAGRSGSTRSIGRLAAGCSSRSRRRLEAPETGGRFTPSLPSGGWAAMCAGLLALAFPFHPIALPPVPHRPDCVLTPRATGARPPGRLHMGRADRPGRCRRADPVEWRRIHGASGFRARVFLPRAGRRREPVPGPQFRRSLADTLQAALNGGGLMVVLECREVHTSGITQDCLRVFDNIFQTPGGLFRRHKRGPCQFLFETALCGLALRRHLLCIRESAIGASQARPGG